MSSTEPQWLVAECDEDSAAALAAESGIPAAAGRALFLRGLTSAREVERFLNPSLDHLHDPSLLPDLDVGVDRIAAAVSSGERICVYGDYDADGVTSAALLVRTLRALRADVTYRLPHRRREGYDIKPSSVDEAAGDGVRVILTCDCGVTAVETAVRANELGIDLVITDHHEPGPELPAARAVVDPKRLDAAYPFPQLAGVGVAFKFAQGLVRRLGFDEQKFLERFVDLAALGTVSDVVPLIDENRAIVKHGLNAIPHSKKLGLQTMLRATRLLGKPLTAHSLGYVLGPRINAVGRLEDASTALRLLLTRDEAEAGSLMAEMERCNSERRAEQDRMLREALEQIECKDVGNSHVLVLSREGWNTGVVGIVAQKICELYARPTVLISRDEASGTGGGSARSTPDFNLIEGLRGCTDLLSRFGGHASAAGISLDLANIEQFENRLAELAREAIGEEVPPVCVEMDAELAPEQITRELADVLVAMEPFGTGNPEPLFLTRGLVVDRRERVGDGSHLKMSLGSDGAAPLECIAFGMGEVTPRIQPGSRVDLCYHIRLNTFNGTQSVQLVGRGIRPS